MKNIWVVKISGADVATRCTTILIINRIDLGKLIPRSAHTTNCGSQSGKSQICADNCVISLSVIILNLLDENKIGAVKVANDVVRNVDQMIRPSPQVLHIV